MTSKSKSVKNRIHRFMALPVILILILIPCLLITSCGLLSKEEEPKKPGYFSGERSVSYAMNKHIQKYLNQDWKDRPDRFYFNQLTDDEKKAYLRIEAACEVYDDGDITFTPISEDSFYRVLATLMRDNPELFWAWDCDMFFDDMSKKTLSKISLNIPEQMEEEFNSIDVIADEIISGIPEDADAYETAEYLFDWVVSNTDYMENERDQDLRSVFFDGISVCTGYANAFQYLCQKVGIPCVEARGEANNGLHSWNLVFVDGTPYWIDVTAGDSYFEDEDDVGNWPINHNYLFMTDDTFVQAYAIDEGFTHPWDIYYDYPECNDITKDYYKQNGMYFEYYDDTVREYILDKLIRDEASGIELKFASREAYDDALHQLFELEDVFSIVEEAYPWYEDASCDYLSNEIFYYLCLNIYV